MKKYISLFFSAFFVIMMLFFPTVCRRGAANGLALCSGVVIPSLFPFTVCALILMRSGASAACGECVAVFLMSALGGYPVGARLVNELYSSGVLSRKDARGLLCCCVNAGPAFLVIAVGSGVFASRQAGYILLCAHIAAAAVIAAFVFPFLKPCRGKAVTVGNEGVFVKAVSDSAASMLSVSAFVVFFSALNAYLTAAPVPFFEKLSYLLEVTAGIAGCNNFYAAAFLSGFAGISVWLQVLAASGSVGTDLRFAVARVLHGALSALFSALLLKVSGVNIQTVSNGKVFSFFPVADTVAVSISLGITAVMFILSVSEKNRGRKIIDDLL